MNINQKEIHVELKNAGYWLAQKIYKDPDSRIYNLEGLIKKYSGRLFNYIHTKRKLELVLYLEKIYAGISTQPNKYIIDILKENNSQKFQSYALAFMMGFLSDKKNENE